MGSEDVRTRRQERQEESACGGGTEAGVLLHQLWVSGETYDPLWNSRQLLAQRRSEFVLMDRMQTNKIAEFG